MQSHGIDFWSGRAQLMKAKSAPWRLVFLSTIFDENGRILVDGWYDDLIPPDEDDLRHLAEELEHFDREELRRQFGLTRDFPYDDTLELLKAIHYGASCNIAGLNAGYTGTGMKTIVAEASAKLDFRCPPNLEPARSTGQAARPSRKTRFRRRVGSSTSTSRKPVQDAGTGPSSQSIIAAADTVFR
ncbi:MAG: hypothetical protein R2873_03905 [Caldilineaceae bacterium]